MKLSLSDLKSFSINIVDECEIKNNFILLIRDIKISNFLPMNITVYLTVIFSLVTIFITLALYSFSVRTFL
jgi:hypothetical protein